MARIPMRNSFTLIPEGTYIFRIEDAVYDDDFGKIEIKMITQTGLRHTEKYRIKNSDDEYNEKALGAFSYFAKTVMDDFSLEDVDPEELIGHYIKAEVIHTEVPSKNDASKTVKFANLGDKAPADGFEAAPAKKGLDIDSLLGD